MQKLVAIVYSFLILVQSLNISLEDVSKFSALLEHAEYHQEVYGDSLIEFISEHYGSDYLEHNAEHQQHKDLPFKSNHQTCIHISFFIGVASTDYILTAKSLNDIPFNYFYKESVSLFEKSSVFQPPKIA